jgi:glycosyltransferase involved in cell wall biosynthesis
VDTELFRPGNRSQSRAAWNLPQEALIVLSVAALKKTHKRCDYLIREFAAFRESFQGPAFLVMAGAREEETPEVDALGKSLLGDSLLMLESVDRAKLPSLYQSADIFAIASLYEMLGIVILEAGASGVPITCNNTPVLEWVAGKGAAPEDISVPGGLVRQWQRLADPGVRAALGAEARHHVERTFSEPVVSKQVQDMYQSVMASE